MLVISLVIDKDYKLNPRFITQRTRVEELKVQLLSKV